MASNPRNKSRIALGIAFISINSMLETIMADHARPNPASPYVWAVLATAGAVALAAFFRYRAQARRAGVKPAAGVLPARTGRTLR
jgi:hypothetical protein